MSFLSFKLNEEFFQEYVDKPVPWGYVDASGSAVSEIVFLRTYSRIKEDGRKETWPEVCRRVVEGTYSIQKDYAKSNRLPWNDNKAQKSAQEAFDRMFNFKWTPPGRGLWSMGTALVNRDLNSAALQNCAFVSTADMTRNNPAEPFCWLMEASMLGVGVGFDTKGADKEIPIRTPSESNEVYQIPDTREGWVESTRLLINAHLVEGRDLPEFDYSAIRPAGEPIRTFGGTAAGPEPLMKLHEKLTVLFRAKEGQVLDTLLIMDIANLIGVCVVSGNVRRCMPQGTLVHTSRGLIPIESVRMGDEVLTSGAPSKVLANMNQGVQKTNVVRTEIGQLEATPNHRVATVKNIHGDLEWKRVDELYPGDKLVFPRKVTPGRETQLPSFTYVKPKRSTTCVDITIPELDVEMAWFLGLFLGDGYVYPNFKNNGSNAYVSVACDPDNRELIDRAVTQLERFGVKATPKEGFKGDRCVKITSISKQLAWYLSQFKTANETIFVPDFIREGCPEIRAAFLAGILDSDGALNNKPVVACSSVYPEFVKDLQDLYASLGIPTVMKLNRPAKGPWKNLYHLNLKGSHPMEDFSRYVLPHSSKKLTRERTAKEQYYYGFNREMVLRDLRYKDFRGIWIPKSERMTVTAAARTLNREVEWYPIEVVSIEGGRTVPTYDIEVQDEHNFIAHGYVVHNSAELAVGNLGDKDFLLAKNYETSPYRSEWGWMSNNSVEVNVGDDLSEIVDGIALNGEPGVIWMDTTRKYGRLADPPNNKDHRVSGYNPCCEQSLESYEMCTLVETYIGRHESVEDYRRTLKFAYLYAKTVTLLPTHWEKTNAIMQRNRRIGTSMSGIANYADNHGMPALREMMDKGYEAIKHYDRKYSEWLCVRESIKTTTVKPSGTVSLLAGESPGVHWAPGGRHHLRGVVFSKDDPMVEQFRQAGYEIHESAYTPETSVFIQFPIESKAQRSEKDVTIFEKINLAAVAQEYWSDNAVSVTVSFDAKEEARHVPTALAMYEGKLKTVSFLPQGNDTYPQMPYQEIEANEYEELAGTTLAVDLGPVYAGNALDAEGERYCTTDKCEIPKR